ncbi:MULTISPECIES: type VII secretion system-associated protein [unclassified Streptomyces]|uniref:type VII secretion system-associated protein n=1 Tax=unclassified Streptomyces TaxID=2593676 RepID=UPI0036EA05E7
MADLTHLDGKTLQAFTDHDIADFLKDLLDIRKDSPVGVKSLKTILDNVPDAGHLKQNQVLAIGLMAADDTVHGKSLIDAVQKAAGSIDDILLSQHTLFTDISKDLQETITTLLETQGKSLDSIDGAALLDIFADVDKELPGTKTGA